MHFKCLNNCNWPTRSSPEPKACNMGSFSLIKSSTDTLCRKPHRMERIISRSSASRAACLSSPSRRPAPSEPASHQRSRDGAWDGRGPASSQVMCPHGTPIQRSAPSWGGPSLPSPTPPRDPGLSPCPGSTPEPRQPPRCWRGARQCHPGVWLSPRADTSRLPGSSRRAATSSISDDKLLLQGAFVGTLCRAGEGGGGGKNGLAGLRQTSKVRASGPGKEQPPSCQRPEEGG